MKRSLSVLCLAALVSTLAPAQTLRWASQGDAQTMDPYSQNELLTNAMNGQVYETLVNRGKSMALEPVLARCSVPVVIDHRPGKQITPPAARQRRDPAPSRLKYRLERMWLTPLYRQRIDEMSHAGAPPDAAAPARLATR